MNEMGGDTKNPKGSGLSAGDRQAPEKNIEKFNPDPHSRNRFHPANGFLSGQICLPVPQSQSLCHKRILSVTYLVCYFIFSL